MPTDPPLDDEPMAALPRPYVLYTMPGYPPAFGDEDAAPVDGWAPTPAGLDPVGAAAGEAREETGPAADAGIAGDAAAGGTGGGSAAFLRRLSPSRRILLGLCVWLVASAVLGLVAAVAAWPRHDPAAGSGRRPTANAGGPAKAYPGAGPASTGSARSGEPGAVGAAPPAPSLASSARPAVARFTAVSGEDCPLTATSGYRRSGMSTDWYTRPRGGWTGDGCGGQVMAVPMSGDVAVDDNDNMIMWWFRPDTVPKGTCAVSVYVPDTGNPLDVAGAPAHYQVYASTSATGTLIGEFDVDQTTHRGQWVSAATLPLVSGQLAVRMVTRGIDWGPGREGAHLGVSAMRAVCQAAK